jgi:hypothetical protein
MDIGIIGLNFGFLEKIRGVFFEEKTCARGFHSGTGTTLG